MGSLACRTCGRRIFTTSPIQSLFPDERRCPRCGAFLQDERREGPRRTFDRRLNPVDAPGPPEGVERRAAERRQTRRRRPEG